MSTPPSTEKFVSGDLFRYTISGKTYSGTILSSCDGALEGWYRCTLDTYGDFKFILPGFNMTKITVERIDIRDLPPISQETLIKHYEIRERELLQYLSRKLQEKIDEVQEDIENHSELEEYHFDAGFTAGLRMAINEIESLTSKLTKNPDE